MNHTANCQDARPRYETRYVALYNEGSAFYGEGDYHSAINSFTSGLEIIEENVGKDNSDYSYMLNNLAQTYSNLGEYNRALEMQLECLDLMDKRLGKEHPDYAMSLNNLAQTYSNLGEYNKALEMFLECLDIYEMIFGKEHPNYAISLGNLALTYSYLGDYDKALKMQLECLALDEKISGKEHPDYAMSLNNLALTYFYLGDYDIALEMNLKCLALREKILGKEHPDYALILNNLASTYSNLGDYVKALDMNLECLALYEKLLGIEHPNYALSLNNLALTYFDLGDYDRALEIELVCLSLMEKIFGKEHPDYAMSLHNLALTYNNLGDYDKALEMNLECLALWEITLGKKHPNYALSLNNLALTYSGLGDYDKALGMISDNLNILQSRILTAEASLDEDLRLQGLISAQTSLQVKSNFLLHEDRPLEYNDWLFMKGRETDATNSIMASLATSSDPIISDVFTKLSSSKRRLSILYETPLQELEDKGIDLKELESEVASLERELISLSSEYAVFRKEYHVSDVVYQLSEGEVLIDIINLPRWSFENNWWSDSSTYLAFVITANNTVPEVVLLGDEISIDGEGLSLYNSYIKGKSDPSIYGQLSYDSFWSPLEPYLEGVETIYYCPEGAYSKINPGVLYIDSTDSYLMDIYDIRHITSAKDFVREKEGFYQNRKRGDYADNKKVVLAGNPSFNLNVPSSPTGDDLAYTRDLFSYQTDTLTRGVFINPLPGTKSEINSISTMFENSGWEIEMFTEDQASEENIKAVNAPQVLHIATHGYFFDDITQMPEMGGLQQMGGTQTKKTATPLMRSGLLFSGAQNTQNEEGIPGDENGWLTAYEASLLNLRNTELVVLSACETGSGDVHNGRGVFGLQRAIKSAGAESLIMSMWSVSDEATSEMMSLFYTNWLGGMSKREALRKAQEEMRAKYSHPFYWGAFVMLGE
jgi:CHAT domain-containing protein/tetratricopeptide (TPR) repeat protein